MPFRGSDSDDDDGLPAFPKMSLPSIVVLKIISFVNRLFILKINKYKCSI